MAAASEPGAPRPLRQRNKRGEGGRLRDEIIAGATALLERTGTEEALTLRAIAREIGIAAPSISRHFADRAAIIDAVVAQELVVLHGGMAAASEAHDDPVERLHAMCQAYVGYGRARPSQYGMLIGRRYLDEWDEGRVMEETAPLLTASIRLVVDAIDACRRSGDSSSTDPDADTLVLWFVMHGLIVVPQSITSVTWPDTEELLVAGMTRCARLTRGPVG